MDYTQSIYLQLWLRALLHCLCWSIQWDVANCSTLFTQSLREDIHDSFSQWKNLTSKIFDKLLRDYLVCHILILRYPYFQVLTRTFPYLLNMCHEVPSWKWGSFPKCLKKATWRYWFSASRRVPSGCVNIISIAFTNYNMWAFNVILLMIWNFGFWCLKG